MQRLTSIVLAAVSLLTLAATPASATPTGTAATATASPSRMRSCGTPRPATLYTTPATHPKTVALTFDDGPSTYTPRFLAVLKRHHVKATFFETGAHVAAMPATSAMVVAAGMRIGNHTYTHPQAVAGSVPYGSFDTLGPKVQVRQIDRTTTVIERTTGQTPCFFRAPGGHDDSVTMRQRVRARGMSVVNWTISTGDSGQPGRLTASSYDAIFKSATANPGMHPIILMHDGKASVEPESQVSSYRGNTLHALPRIIRWYAARGYVFTDPSGRRF